MRNRFLRQIRVISPSLNRLTIARVFGVTVSYPFQVIMIRQMAEFLHKSNSYKYMLLAFLSVIKQDGPLGLFSGLMPRVIGEVITVWLTACFAYVLNNYVFTRGTDPSLKKHTPFIAGMMVSGMTHSLTVTSTAMAACDSRYCLFPHFSNWLNCYTYLKRNDYFVRGNSLFFRRVPQSMNPRAY